MIIEQTNSEILIRIPKSVDTEGIQRALNYIRYKELTSDVQTNQDEVNLLADEIDNNWWKQNKDRLLK